MTGSKMVETPGAGDTVVPPPGPLTWLNPEVALFEPPRARSPAILDLGAEPLSTAELVARLAGRRELTLAAGPRGRTLGRVVRQLLRQPAADREVDIALDAAVPQLETLLPALAAEAPPGHALRRDRSFCRLGDLSADEIGLLLLRPAAAAADLAAAAASRPASGARVIPVFITDPRPATTATTRLPESWWGLLPGDAYPDAVRAGLHALMRRFWPQRLGQLRGYENLALAGFDLYDEMLRGRYDLRPDRATPRPTARPWIFAVDGVDGAGKSSQIAALRDHLEARGLRVAIHKMYRHGVFHDTITDATRACAGDRNLHLWALQRHVKLFDSVKYYYRHVVPDLARYDALVFDRYVQTHLAAGPGRYGHDAWAREFTSVYPPADRVYLLDLPIEVALERIAARQSRTVDENPYMLGRFRAALLELAARGAMVTLDSRADLAAGSARIRADVDRLLERGR